jgi:hypothetical protein
MPSQAFGVFRKWLVSEVFQASIPMTATLKLAEIRATLRGWFRRLAHLKSRMIVWRCTFAGGGLL